MREKTLWAGASMIAIVFLALGFWIGRRTARPSEFQQVVQSAAQIDNALKQNPLAAPPEAPQAAPGET